MSLPRIVALNLLLAAGVVWAQQAPVAYHPIGDEAYGLLKAVYEYDAEIPLDARIVELKDNEESVRRKVVFRGVRGFMVPGYLEFPKQVQPPYPCVLLLHGWSGGKENWWEDGNYISGGEAREALVKAGFAVFALDAQAHGDRIAEDDYNVVNLYNEPGAPPRKNYFTLREIVVQTVRDYRRGIDYLASRGDIDLSRLGMLGYSMGGFQTVALTAMEPRIRVAAGCVVPVSWREDPILDPANYARGIGDRPFMMLMGRNDSLCNEEQARALYALIEHPETRLIIYDSEHRLPVNYVEDAVPWLTEQLNRVGAQR